MNSRAKVSPVGAGLVYAAFAVYFVLLLSFLLPWLRDDLRLHQALCWFLTGYALFVPMCVLSILAVRREGARSRADFARALRLRPLGRSGWLIALGLTALGTLLTGGIMAGANLLGVGPLEATPWFLAFRPFQGAEILLLIVWAGMFSFNILGEEFLWRGYLQSRMASRTAWIWGTVFWAGFHIPFGIDLMIMLLPILVILPYAVHRTQNTTVGIVIHGLYNGPAFVLVALGVLH